MTRNLVGRVGYAKNSELCWLFLKFSAYIIANMRPNVALQFRILISPHCASLLCTTRRQSVLSHILCSFCAYKCSSFCIIFYSFLFIFHVCIILYYILCAFISMFSAFFMLYRCTVARLPRYLSVQTQLSGCVHTEASQA